MSDFALLWPDLAWNAASVTPWTEDADYPAENLFVGSSSLLYKAASAATGPYIRFDMGSPRSVEFAYLRGIHHLASLAGGESNLTLTIRSSDDAFSSQSVRAIQNPVTLVGPKSEDALLLSEYTGTHRYWEIRTAITSSQVAQYRKLYAGNMFRFKDKYGNVRSPTYPYLPEFVDGAKPFLSDRGTQFRSGRAKPQRRYTFQIQAVSDASRKEFEEKIARIRDDVPVGIYYSGDHDPLSGAKVVLGWIRELSISAEQWKDMNRISFTIVEDTI